MRADSFSPPRLLRRQSAVELVGDPSTVVDGVAPLDRASQRRPELPRRREVRADVWRHRRRASCWSRRSSPRRPAACCVRIVVDKPQEALLSLLPRFHRLAAAAAGVHATAVDRRGVRLGPDVSVGPYAVIGDGAEIGESVVIGAHCVVGAGVRIGDANAPLPVGHDVQRLAHRRSG